MLFWRKSDRQPLQTRRLVGRFPPLGAKGQVILHGILTCPMQLIDGLPLKRHHIPDIDDFAMKDIRPLLRLVWVTALSSTHKPSSEGP